MTEGLNTEFGLPPVSEKPVVETEDQRIARLRAKAVATVNAETDEAVLKRLIAEERARVAPKAPDAQGFAPEYSRIVISPGQNKTDQDFVPLGINGYIIKVPRGKEVIIPTCFITECLERAVEEATVSSNQGYITRPNHRFHWQVKGTATAEEYETFRKGQQELMRRDLAQVAA